MKTYIFIEKNGNCVITTSADDFSEAEDKLAEVVKDTWQWRVENEEGEDE